MTAPIYPIPPSSPVRACRSCGAGIHWILTPAGKRCPVNPDGVSHFATCPNAATHSRRKPTAPIGVTKGGARIFGADSIKITVKDARGEQLDFVTGFDARIGRKP